MNPDEEEKPIKRGRGRPPTGRGIQVGLRLPEAVIEQVDHERLRRNPPMTRAKMLRVLIEERLAGLD